MPDNESLTRVFPPHALEQGQADRGQAPITAEAYMGDQNSAELTGTFHALIIDCGRAIIVAKTASPRETGKMDYSKICFVIMPFGKKPVGDRPVDFDRLYDDIFVPAISAVSLPEGGKLESRRTDKDFYSGDIKLEMFQYLEYSRFALADISGLNFNVAYERPPDIVRENAERRFSARPRFPLPSTSIRLRRFLMNLSPQTRPLRHAN